jgi:hypothetical protein
MMIKTVRNGVYPQKWTKPPALFVIVRNFSRLARVGYIPLTDFLVATFNEFNSRSMVFLQ